MTLTMAGAVGLALVFLTVTSPARDARARAGGQGGQAGRDFSASTASPKENRLWLLDLLVIRATLG